MMIEKLKADHEKIREIVARFCELLFPTEACDSARLAAVRWELGSAVMQNLAFEERQIYSRITISSNQRVRALMTHPEYELSAIFAVYTRHVESWPPARVAVGWLEYRKSADMLLEALLKRMEWEEREIFPLVRNGTLADGPHASLGRNWAREAFAIKDRLLSASPGNRDS